MRKLPLRSLEKKLDKLFSIYTRRKYADQGGTVRCCTCPKLMFWKEADCGHWIKRQHRSTRWDERNVGPQCQRCNHFMGGCQDEFAQHIIAEHGLAAFNDLLALKHKVFKPNRDWYETKISEYTAELKALDLKEAA